MTTALVPLTRTPPPAPAADSWPSCLSIDRFDTICAIELVGRFAMLDGHIGISLVLEQVAIALRGARGVDLHTELTLFLEREGLL